MKISKLHKRNLIEIYWKNATIDLKVHFLNSYILYYGNEVNYSCKSHFYNKYNNCMRTIIYKYRLDQFRGITKLYMPLGAHIIKFGEQNSIPCIWVEIDTDVEETDQREIQLVYTGEVFDKKNTSTYLGTIFCGDLVIHGYELHKYPR